jgi:hypothetical protein
MIADVKKIFDQELTAAFGTNQNVLNFLIKHERKEICLNNLCANLISIEKRVIVFNAEKYRYVIKNVAMMFADRALKVAEESALSKAERTRREDQSRQIEIAKETIQEFEGGIYKGILDPESPSPTDKV